MSATDVHEKILEALSDMASWYDKHTIVSIVSGHVLDGYELLETLETLNSKVTNGFVANCSQQENQCLIQFMITR